MRASARRDGAENGSQDTRSVVARGFTWVEDIAYFGLGPLLAASARDHSSPNRSRSRDPVSKASFRA